jgi:hypothetical protein
VIGKDTRLSGYMLEPALTAGFVTMGMDVVLVGPLTSRLRCCAQDGDMFEPRKNNAPCIIFIDDLAAAG